MLNEPCQLCLKNNNNLPLTLPKLPGLCPSAHGSPHKGPVPRQGPLWPIIETLTIDDMKNKYNVILLIIILLILIADFLSGIFRINKGVEYFITDFLFAVGSLTILFGWEMRIFVIMNILGFIKLNLGLATNSFLQSVIITDQLAFNLLMTKWVLTIITFVFIILGFYDKIVLSFWKEKIKINRKRIIAYYLTGTIILQLVIQLI
jgi:hypothetical protein